METMPAAPSTPPVHGAAAPRTHPTNGKAQAIHAVLLRPELTAVAGTAVVFLLFALLGGNNGFLGATGIGNVLAIAADIGIIAAPMTLLMVAGEFDLSIGSMYGAAQFVFAYAVVTEGWGLWLGLICALAVATVVGLINGFLVAKTRIPSFLVTLATMFLLQGASAALSNKLLGETTVSGVNVALGNSALLSGIFTGTIGGWVPATVVWWLCISGAAAWLLDRTRFGNWIYATGGALESAKRAGIPTGKVKTKLFVATAWAAAIAGILSALSVNTADVNSGTGDEFEVIVAVVIGGTMIWGGTGTVLGTIVGALFFGLVYEGFFFTNIDTNWFQALLGGLLLLAVLVNTYTRTIAARRAHEHT